jgi:hypothetical protein
VELTLVKIEHCGKVLLDVLTIADEIDSQLKQANAQLRHTPANLETGHDKTGDVAAEGGAIRIEFAPSFPLAAEKARLARFDNPQLLEPMPQGRVLPQSCVARPHS